MLIHIQETEEYFWFLFRLTFYTGKIVFQVFAVLQFSAPKNKIKKKKEYFSPNTHPRTADNKRTRDVEEQFASYRTSANCIYIDTDINITMRNAETYGGKNSHVAGDKSSWTILRIIHWINSFSSGIKIFRTADTISSVTAYYSIASDGALWWRENEYNVGESARVERGRGEGGGGRERERGEPDLEAGLELDEFSDAVVHLLHSLIFGEAETALVGDIVNAALGLGMLAARAAHLQIVLRRDFLQFSHVRREFRHLDVDRCTHRRTQIRRAERQEAVTIVVWERQSLLDLVYRRH